MPHRQQSGEILIKHKSRKEDQGAVTILDKKQVRQHAIPQGYPSQSSS